MRISRVPSNSVTRLRTISKDDLRRALQVVSQHQLVDGHYRPVELTAPLAKHKGTRFKGDILQLGLTRNEIGAVYRRMQSLLKKVDKGKLDTF